MDLDFLSNFSFLLVGTGGAVAVLAGALALGIRHGMDWDHIAAITDITSATAAQPLAQVEAHEHAPGVLFARAGAWEFEHGLAGGGGGGSGYARVSTPSPPRGPPLVERVVARWRRIQGPLFPGTMYALGHGSMVVVLGLVAILFSEFLPTWIDPIMERVVGVTLLLLAAYLFFQVYRYFRGGEFRLRSRWMLVFAAVGRGWRWARDRATGRVHQHAHQHIEDRPYGAATAYGIGLIHGVGAETGTQVLIIGAAVGAGSKGMSVATLMAFVVGLLISNTIVTIASSAGFVSAQRRQVVYVAVGLVAAVFSLVVGLVFLSQSADILPNLDPYVRWVGGPA